MLTEPPSFLSAVSMVVDNREEIIRALVRAEQKSPPFYKPAQQLFIAILQGDFSYDKALEQADKLTDETERKCALSVLETSKAFLTGETPARVGPLTGLKLRLPNGLDLGISSVWIRHCDPDRLLVLHFWLTPLSQIQLSAAGSILRASLTKKPTHLFSDIDFVSVSDVKSSGRRIFRKYDWDALNPLSEDELQRFLSRFCDAWTEYQKRDARRFKKRRSADLFD